MKNMIDAKFKYEDIRDKLKTGDVVLFSGHGFIARTISWISRSKWTHVGLVVKIEDMDLVTLWESTSISKTAALSGSLVKGVQSVFLDQRIREYEGTVAVRMLDYGLVEEQLKRMSAFRHAVKGVPYEKNFFELAASAIDLGPDVIRDEDLTSLFCSELCAEAFQMMGILGSRVPSNEYTPGDFGAGGKIDDYLIGYRLGPEIEIHA